MAYYDDELGRRREVKVARHVRLCDECCRALAAYGRLAMRLHGLDAVATRQPDGTVTSATPLRRAARATTVSLLLLVGLAVIAFAPRPTSDGRESLAPPTSPRGLSVAPAPPRTPMVDDDVQHPRRASDSSLQAASGPSEVVSSSTTDEPGGAAPADPEIRDPLDVADGTPSPPPSPSEQATQSSTATVPRVGVVAAGQGPQAALAQRAARVFTQAVGVASEVADDADALTDIAHLADDGARLVVIPVWPEGLDVAAVSELAASRDILVLSGGSASADRVMPLRPDAAVEARGMADRLGATSAPVVVFVGPSADDRAFASTVRKELDAKGLHPNVLPDDLCSTRLAFPGETAAVLATHTAGTASCLEAGGGRQDLRFFARVEALQGIETIPSRVAAVSPLALPTGSERVSLVRETLLLSWWSSGLVHQAAGSNGDPAAGLSAVSRPAWGSYPAVDLAQARPVHDGTLLDMEPLRSSPSS